MIWRNSRRHAARGARLKSPRYRVQLLVGERPDRIIGQELDDDLMFQMRID
jgi:hypothetical protein